MVFINSDKDWLHTSKVPNSAPMAYALKGKSMSTVDLHHLINTCRCELLKRNIPILCEVYDGQWKNVVTFNEAGEPLTLLQMFKKSWDAVSRMSKDRMIQEVMKLSQIMAGDLDIMTYTYHFDVSITTLANVRIQHNTSGPLEIELLGGQKYRESVMSFIKTCYLQKLWTGDYEEIPEDQSSKVNKKRKLGLQENESNILALLDSEVLQAISAEDAIDPKEMDVPVISPLEKTLSSSEITLLSDICAELKSLNPKKWSNLEPDHLFPDILQNPGEMLKAFTLKDIQTTSKTLERHTGWQWYSYKLSKHENINNIVAAFDSKEFPDPVTTTRLI